MMQVLYFSDAKLSGINPTHLESLVALVREVWDKDATVERYMAARTSQFKKNPYMKKDGYPLTLLVDKDKVAGQCNSVPCRLWAGKKEWTMFWNAGLHLLPEYRGKGLGLVLPEELARQLPIISAVFVLPQQLRTHQKLGFHIIGKIPDYIKLYQPSRFFREMDFDSVGIIPDKLKNIMKKRPLRVPLSWCFSAGMELYKVFRKERRTWKDREIRFSFVDEFDFRVDRLWENVKHSIRFAQVRNALYMNWQFNSSAGWKKIIMEDHGQLVGMAIIAVRQNGEKDKLANLKLLSTIDLLWDFNREDILPQYFRFIDSYANSVGADMAFCSINQPAAVCQLKKSGYLKIPGTVYFVARSQCMDVELSSRMDDWYITRGDADAAGSLGVVT